MGLMWLSQVISAKKTVIKEDYLFLARTSFLFAIHFSSIHVFCPP